MFYFTKLLFIFNFTFFQFTLAEAMFYSYFIDEQPLKTLDTIKPDYMEVHRAFSDRSLLDNQIVQDFQYYNVFKIKNDKELIASVYLRKTKYYTKKATFFRYYLKEEDCVEIYSLYVSDKYKKQGYARQLLYYACTAMREHYNLANDFIIGLHLNESDKFMNISFAFYYAINFRKSTYVESGPSEYKTKFQEYFNFADPVTIIDKLDFCQNKGCYLAMYTRYCDLLPFNPIRNKKTLLVGEKLRKILKNRKSLK